MTPAKALAAVAHEWFRSRMEKERGVWVTPPYHNLSDDERTALEILARACIEIAPSVTGAKGMWRGLHLRNMHIARVEQMELALVEDQILVEVFFRSSRSVAASLR